MELEMKNYSNHSMEKFNSIILTKWNEMKLYQFTINLLD